MYLYILYIFGGGTVYLLLASIKWHLDAEINRGEYLYCCTPFSSEVQTAVSKTWREFTCGTLNRLFLNDTGDPLICDGFQYGIISHTYQTSMPAAETESADQVRFVIVDHHREWIDHVIMTDNQLSYSDGRRNAASRRLVVILVVMTVVFRLLSQFR